MSALGEENVHSKLLFTALDVDRARFNIATVDRRIKLCKSSLERVPKRAGRLEEVIAGVTIEKDVCRRSGAVASTQVEVPVCASVDAVLKKRDVPLAATTSVLPRPAQCSDGPPSLDNIPPLPSANVRRHAPHHSDRIHQILL